MKSQDSKEAREAHFRREAQLEKAAQNDASEVDQAKKSEALKTRILTGAGVCLLAATLYTRGSQLLHPVAAQQQPRIVREQVVNNATQAKKAALASYWANPPVSLLERFFCRGNKISSGCSNRPLHPFVDVYKQLDWPLPPPLEKSQEPVYTESEIERSGDVMP